MGVFIIFGILFTFLPKSQVLIANWFQFKLTKKVTEFLSLIFLKLENNILISNIDLSFLGFSFQLVILTQKITYTDNNHKLSFQSEIFLHCNHEIKIHFFSICTYYTKYLLKSLYEWKLAMIFFLHKISNKETWTAKNRRKQEMKFWKRY